MKQIQDSPSPEVAVGGKFNPWMLKLKFYLHLLLGKMVDFFFLISPWLGLVNSGSFGWKLVEKCAMRQFSIGLGWVELLKGELYNIPEHSEEFGAVYHIFWLK